MDYIPGYADDSFFTLTASGQVGLAVLSLGLACLMGLAALRLHRVLWALALFGAFVWLSPQVYYLYYVAIIDGLPWQIVVGRPPGPGTLLRLLTFTGDANLSDHGKGVLGWAMIALAAGSAVMRRGRQTG
ncbi:hypothetical protein MWU52_14635 [Jannaschia sp. S6380]|uniref:hypothetical protein n=1 Tax=Jannaschia sp. S6380 TaxID=2926408 RepID=UPI001FF279E7|nr:hypothetical protein [Jannaschia sp. S6380]MCK0168793.1 hypothetical protein [Jannaschia sp. S6380]